MRNYIPVLFTPLLIFLFVSVLFFPFRANADAAAQQEEINTLNAQIKLELQKLQQIEAKISRINKAQEQKVKNLVSIYSSMSAQKAAGILPGINKGVAIYILSHMTARKASAVISDMPVKDAVFFTDSIAGK